jgi:predicted metalloprotease
VYDKRRGGEMAKFIRTTTLPHRRRTRGAFIRRGILKRLGFGGLVIGCALLIARAGLSQDDDWSVVSDQVQDSHPAKTEAPRTVSKAALEQHQSASGGARMICGEMARPAAEPYKSIVADIDREWGAHVPVYESVEVGSPHVSRGGCIFYNPVFMDVFLRGETDTHGEPDRTSMLYAIMAHELGHIEHHDYERKASSVTKELEADRFSGYTLSRMGIPRDNITPFYSLGGDEFSGVRDHGFSNQRIAAFDLGWKRAEWNQPEDGGSAAPNAGAKSLSDDSGDVENPSAAAVP